MKIAVFYGGRSCEHDISVITAIQAMGNLDATKYEVIPVYMQSGAFYTGEVLKSIDFYHAPELKKCTRLYLYDGKLHTKKRGLSSRAVKLDVALICCHGGEGENGCLQGMLEMNGIAYTSAAVTGSALSMDKAIAKQLLNGLMYNTVEEICICRDDFNANKTKILRHVETFLEYPVIVKPSGLGSSIGIKTAKNRDELAEAITVAAAFDRKIIVERALVNFTELNCAVVSDGREIIVSEVEQPISWSDFLTFDDKYMSGGKGSDGRRIPADIPESLRDSVKDLSERIFKDFDLSGVVRIDYLLSENGKLYVNEINTIPGSLAFYLFEPLGISFTALLDKMIEGAIIRAEENKKSRFAYKSDVLLKFGRVGGKCLQK